MSFDHSVQGATFPSHEFLFGTDKADVWLGIRLYLAWWQEVLRDLLLTFNPWCFCRLKEWFFSLFLSFFPFLLLAWIYVKWTECIIHIWQGSWKRSILFLTILTVLLINPSSLIPLITVRFFFFCRCLKCDIRCFPQSCVSDLHHCSNQTQEPVLQIILA